MSDNRLNTGNPSPSGDVGLRVKIDQSRGRQTANTSFGHVMSEGLNRGANAVLQAGQLAAPFVPGGAVLSAAITGVGTLKSSAAGQGASFGATAAAPNGTSLVASTGTAGAGGTGVNGQVNALAASGDKQAIMMRASQEMQEMNMSFNMQYLGLQQKMQDESRRFTMLSNVMKTKHDTAKNSISNVR